MRLKKATVALLAAASLVLAACGGGGGGGGGGDASSSGGGGGGGAGNCPVDALAKATAPVQLTMWHAMTSANADTLQKLADQYNAAQAKVHVTLAFQGNYDETREKYLAAVRGGSGPDVVQLEDTQIQTMLDSQTIVQAQDCIDAEKYDLSDFLPRTLSYYRVKNRLVTMPFNVSSPLLYFNKVAFRNAGLDPEKPPATIDDLRADAIKITQAKSAQHGFAQEVVASYFEQWFAQAGQPFVDNGNGRQSRATKTLIDTPLGQRLFQFFKSGIDEGWAVNVGRNPTAADALLAVRGQNAAMAFGTSAALGTVYALLGNGIPGIELGVAPFPKVQGDQGLKLGGASLYIVKGSSPEKQAAAWDFIKFLDDTPQQITWSTGTGYIPIRNSAAQSPEIQKVWTNRPGYKLAFDQLQAGTENEATAGSVMGPFVAVRDTFESGLERMILQHQDPAASLKQTEQETTAKLQEYNQRVGG